MRNYIKQLFPKGCFISSLEDSRYEILQEIIQHLSKEDRKDARDLCNYAKCLIEKQSKMSEKFRNMLFYEKDLISKGYKMIGGIDEAGRGPLAGPVVASCVILDIDTPIFGIDDSKKLNEARRESLYWEIKKNAIAVGIGIIDNKIIDEINILQASLEAMVQAVKNLPIKPDFLLIDGQFSPEIDFPKQAIISGDSKIISIASASIIAKVTRDKIMLELDKIYPQYGFSQNKGYPTKEHISAIKKYGPCDVHRKTFTPVADAIYQLSISFNSKRIQ
ncbi:MAG: ribonuclease HII [Candidatus Poribacteria bacterium]